MKTREDYITHLMMMYQKDKNYAICALAQYVAWLPHFDLDTGVRDARRAAK
jgi:hypothetical protein